MKCSVMQPGYFPWLGLFDLISSVDKFVFLDDVKLQRHSWDVRNKIKTPQGELYLTVPIKRTKGPDQLKIKEAICNDDEPWRKKHLRSIYINYRKAELFNQIYPFLEKLIDNKTRLLVELNTKIIITIAKKIGLNKKFLFSSQLKNISGRKDSRLVKICKTINCDTYISPKGAADYIERKSPGGEFTKNGIKLIYQDYHHPTYKQLYGNFLPFMSIIDLIFNYGFKKSLEVIRGLE